MAWKPKTVAGKILKGVTIGAGVAAAGLLIVGTAGATIPAIGGAITATGGVVGKVLKGAVKTVDAVGTKAADIVSPINKVQRELVRVQQDETRVEVEKVTAIEKLIKAGSTVQKAAAAVGVPLTSLAGLFGLPAAVAAAYDAETVPMTKMVGNKQLLTYGAIGLAALFLLPKILKR